MSGHKIEIKVTIHETADAISGNIELKTSLEDLAQLSPVAVGAVCQVVTDKLIENHLKALALCKLQEMAEGRVASKAASAPADLLAKLIKRSVGLN